jgi:4-amino-4-deoxy-L-arabinose transferase-like glycosyltransferase
MLTYAAFALIYVLGERKRYGLLFLSTYALAALVFLIKGMPALMHQGIALLVYFVGAGQWRRLISAGHVAGIALMTGILALYYAPFFLRSDLPAMEVYGKLFGESTKRFAYDGPLDFILVLLDFPPDFIKHFMPWTLLAAALFSRNVRRAVWADPFIRYNAVLFAAIIPVYWVASLKSPHYFHFILPSFFTVAVYAWHRLPSEAQAVRAMRWLVLIVLSLLAIAVIYLPFMGDPSKGGDDFDVLYRPVLVAVALVLVVLAWRQYRSPQTLWYLAAGLIVVRIVFNVFVMPRRIGDQMTYPRLAGEIQAFVGDAPLAICASYPAGYYDPITFPLEEARRQILPVVAAPPATGYCLSDQETYQRIGGEVLLQFPFVYMDNLERHKGEMFLVKVAAE